MQGLEFPLIIPSEKLTCVVYRVDRESLVVHLETCAVLVHTSNNASILHTCRCATLHIMVYTLISIIVCAYTVLFNCGALADPSMYVCVLVQVHVHTHAYSPFLLRTVLIGGTIFVAV